MKISDLWWIKFLVCSYLFLLSGQIYAASFDCTKASSLVENLICSNKELSDLDNTLGDLFNSAKENSKTAITDQKQWLHNQRNVCKTEECLKLAYTKRIEHLKTLGRCPIDNLATIGGWVKVKGEGFEEMKFLMDDGIQTFISWIHHKPEMTGTWKIEQCTIHIQDGNEGNLQFFLKIKKLDEGKLYVLDADNGAEIVYKKVRSRQ